MFSSGIFDSLGPGVAQADFTRYAIMHQFGGVYADMDFECKASFGDLVSRCFQFLSNNHPISLKDKLQLWPSFFLNLFDVWQLGHPDSEGHPKSDYKTEGIIFLGRDSCPWAFEIFVQSIGSERT